METETNADNKLPVPGQDALAAETVNTAANDNVGGDAPAVVPESLTLRDRIDAIDAVLMGVTVEQLRAGKRILAETEQRQAEQKDELTPMERDRVSQALAFAEGRFSVEPRAVDPKAWNPHRWEFAWADRLFETGWKRVKVIIEPCDDGTSKEVPAHVAGALLPGPVDRPMNLLLPEGDRV